MRELWLMDPDGGNPRKLLTLGELGDLENIHWSPDGRELLYLKSDENRARRSIKIRNVKSGDSHVVLSNPRLRELDWLRDGRVVYALAEGADEGTCNYWIARVEQAQSHAAHEHDLVQKRSKFPDGVFEQWKVWIRH